MANWVIKIKQTSNGMNLNVFDIAVEADHKEEAIQLALAKMEDLSDGLQTTHVQDNPFANAERRPYRRIGWKNARNVVIAVRRIKE